MNMYTNEYNEIREIKVQKGFTTWLYGSS